MKTAVSFDLALAAARRHREIHGHYDYYTGIVTLHGLARPAAGGGREDIVSEARGALLPYVRGERAYRANFSPYFCGGNATAHFFWRGHLPEARDVIGHQAEELLTAPRDAEGIFSHPKRPGQECIWIDVAFAQSPKTVCSIRAEVSTGRARFPKIIGAAAMAGAHLPWRSWLPPAGRPSAQGRSRGPLPRPRGGMRPRAGRRGLVAPGDVRGGKILRRNLGQRVAALRAGAGVRNEIARSHACRAL